jgi:hypothetical protein
VIRKAGRSGPGRQCVCCHWRCHGDALRCALAA